MIIQRYNNHTWIARMGDPTTFHHLSCFAGGMFSLGEHTNPASKTPKFFELGKNITETCYESYTKSPSGLGGEVVKGSSLESDGVYNLRPETVESIFYLYRFTKDEKYRQWGWKIINVNEINRRA